MGKILDFNLDLFTRHAPVSTSSKLIIFRYDPGDPVLVDARRWLERELWDTITGFNSSAQLKIVENGPDEQLVAEYEMARLVIVPLRIPLLKSARPLLEAMAMGLPLVITSAVLQSPIIKETLAGLKLGDHFVRADTTTSFGALAARLLEIRSPGMHLGREERRYAEEYCRQF